jgi:hypothetical protein
LTNSDELFLQSDTRRDLLHSAQVFQTEKQVIWEYVTNGFSYVDPGVKPIVKVFLDTKGRRIVVSDNGRGMDWNSSDGLANFFVMHAENVDRKAGKSVRGYFGTGKSAAFGIADVLRITTVRNGKRSRVELTRSKIQRMRSGERIPVDVLEKDIPTTESNGTKVEVENVHLRTLDVQGTRRFIERHLARLPKGISIFVNKQECEFQEPAFDREEIFAPEGKLLEDLGKVELHIKVSRAPLDAELRGIAISANGNWHETTLAGSEGRDMANHIFGHVDVPQLDTDDSPIAPFDLSRSMKLNPSNRIVQCIYAFISRHVEVIRRELVEQDRSRKRTEEAKRLKSEAAKIADIINSDFDSFRNRLSKTRAKARGGSDVHDTSLEGGESEDDLIHGGQLPAEMVEPHGAPAHEDIPAPGPGPGPSASGDVPIVQPSDKVDAPHIGKASGGHNSRPKSRGGFLVEFLNSGPEAHRAYYDRTIRTILINLDHPQISAAKGRDTEDNLPFRRLAYEVAFTEYSVALQRELVERGEYLEMDEPLQEVRSTLDRLARRGAVLYAAP